MTGDSSSDSGTPLQSLARQLQNVSSQENAELLASNDSDIIRETLRVYGSIYLVSMAIFAIVRKLYPRLFNIRAWVPEMKCELASKEYGWLSWFWEVFRVTDDQLLAGCGMDAVCFLRSLAFGRRLCYVGCLNGIWLIPLYVTAEDSEETHYLSDPLVLSSISNLPLSSRRFLGTVFAAYLTFIWAMYLIYNELTWFTKKRHEFLSQRRPRNFAVYVSGVPAPYRSSFDLAQYFRHCSSQDSVLEAHITMNVPDLESKVAKRDALVKKLEHEVALERRTGSRRMHHRVSLQKGVERVDSIATFERQLSKLDREIQLAVGEILNNNDPLRSKLARDEPSRHLMVDHSTSTDDDDDDEHAGDEYGDDLDDEMRRIISPRQETDFERGAHYFSQEFEYTRSIDSQDDLAHASREGVAVSSGGGIVSVLSPVEEVISSEVEELSNEMQEIEQSKWQKEDQEEVIMAPSDDELSEDYRGDEHLSGVQAEAFLQDLNMLFHAPTPDSGKGLTQKTSEETREGWAERGTLDVGEDEEAPFPDVEAPRLPSIDSDISEIRDVDSEGETDAFKKAYSQHSMESKASSKSSVGSSSASMLRSARKSMSHGSKVIASSSKVAGSSIRTASSSIAKSSRVASKSIAKSSRLAGSAIIKVAKDANVDKIIYSAGEKAQTIGSQLVTSAGTVVPLLVSKVSGSPRDAGFVVFTSVRQTMTALQVVNHPRPYSMDVQEAPDPKDIFWRNVGMPHRARRTGRALSVSATAVLCIFWSIPTAAISSLTEVNSLKESLPNLGAFIEAHPGFESMLALIAPLLLLFISEVILPSILKYFATWEGHVSSAMLEASLFLKLGCFMIIQTFFVSAISGSISAELTNILDEPKEVINLLANSLPAQSSYFMQIVLTSTFLLQAMETLRVYPLSLALLRKCVGPNLTKKERRRSWGMIKSLEDPPDFWHAETFAQLILYYIVFLVYAAIAPVTSYLMLGCFLLLESGYRYQYIHNYPQHFETGGRLWRSFLYFTLGSLIIGELTILGLLLLKQSFYALPAMVPLLVITVLFIFFVNGEHSRVSFFLPIRDCVLLDQRMWEEAVDFNFVQGAYLQPALRNDAAVPEYDDHEEIDERKEARSFWFERRPMSSSS